MSNQPISPDTINLLTVWGFVITVIGLYIAVWEFWKKRTSSNRRDDVELSKELESICNQPNPHPIRLQIAFRSLFKRTLEPEKIIFIWKEMPNPVPNIRQFLLGHPYIDLDVHKRQIVYAKGFTKRGIIGYKIIALMVYALFFFAIVIFVNYWHAGRTGSGLGFNILISLYLISISWLGLYGSICLKAASHSVNGLKFPGSDGAKEITHTSSDPEPISIPPKEATPLRTHPKSHHKRTH